MDSLSVLNPLHYRINPAVQTYLPEFKRITRCNVERFLDSGSIQIAMHSGAWLDIRRNGKTRLWERSPQRLRIPYKFGLYGYGAITEEDFSTAPLKADVRCEQCQWLEMALDHSRRFV